jgi:transcription antitermination factor NusG
MNQKANWSFLRPSGDDSSIGATRPAGTQDTGIPRTGSRVMNWIHEEPGEKSDPGSGGVLPAAERRWYAVFTFPQSEKSVVRQLDLRQIESFLPTYETVRVWKNRQRVKIVLPLFPTYLFVRIETRERVRVLQAPGVLQIIGNGRENASLQDSEIDLLRFGCKGKKIEPYTELVVGERVRIKNGVMQGIEGVLVRRSHNLRFVLTVEAINQHAAVEVSAEDLEPLVN